MIWNKKGSVVPWLFNLVQAVAGMKQRQFWFFFFFCKVFLVTLDLLICFYKILSGQARQLLAYETYVSLEFYVEVLQ